MTPEQLIAKALRAVYDCKPANDYINRAVAGRDIWKLSQDEIIRITRRAVEIAKEKCT